MTSDLKSIVKIEKIPLSSFFEIGKKLTASLKLKNFVRIESDPTYFPMQNQLEKYTNRSVDSFVNIRVGVP